MAQRVVVETLDDVDGEPATETVRFGLDGTSYEIDLTGAHAAELRNALASYLAVARRETRLSKPARQTSVVVDVDPTAVRAWARSNGIAVSPRGRLSASVVEQFRAAGN